jgi:hypothetical protein
MSIADLEAQLRAAQKRQSLLGRTIEEIQSASAAVLYAERALAAARGEPHAVPLDFPASWSGGAPAPLLLQNDYTAFLVFYLDYRDSRWDGASLELLPSDSPHAEGLAVVQFERCICTKMGTPDEDVLKGHPLHGKGLAGHQALMVKNSSWIKDLESINAVDSQYDPSFWRQLEHYILPFHDSTFECVALSFKIEIRHIDPAKLLAEICRRL